ncbi:MAG: patatin-like phospholipase family protein, partial [Balneolaceae bacterium]
MRFPTLQRDVLWLATLLWLLPVYGYSQSEKHSRFINNQKNIKIGLALSGGGAKGFAHIGLLKVFEKEGIPVNMISGTSMGAIIGSLYAIGYTPEQIEDIVLSTDWGILFNDSYRINPQNIASSVSSKPTYLITFPFNDRKLQLPSGLIDGQNISMLLYRLMLPYHNVQDFTELPIPFSAVATDLSTGQAHTFTKGYLPDAVRASSAIPTIFKPVKVDGSTYIDGGVARNIPAEDVRKLGADLVISSDVGEPVKPVDSLHTFVDILFQSVGFHQQESNKKQIQNSDFYIHPDIQDFSSFSYDHAKEIIRKGEEAAHKLVPLIKSFLNEHHAHVSSSPFKSISSPQNDTLLITNIRFANINGLLKKQVNVTLNIKIPSRLTLHTIEKKINRLYNSGLFSQISYRIQYDSTSRVDGHQLLLKFQQKEQEYVGF